MNKNELLDKLLGIYRRDFDIECPYKIQETSYDAYGAFNVTTAKYVLTKKTELWRAQCYEHVFFKSFDTLTEEEIEKFHRQITEYIEPQMVRKEENCPPPDHMYTFLTGIFISEGGLSKEVVKAVKKFRFSKNYRFTIRGYCDARFVVFDLENKKLYGNPAAREILKGYRKMLPTKS